MKLIDVGALIEDLEYDVELDARELDDTDLSLGRNREIVQFDKDCKQNAIDMLKKASAINAIPIEWLEEKLTGHPELPYAITDGITNVLDLWKAEKEKQNEE